MNYQTSIVDPGYTSWVYYKSYTGYTWFIGVWLEEAGPEPWVQNGYRTLIHSNNGTLS